MAHRRRRDGARTLALRPPSRPHGSPQELLSRARLAKYGSTAGAVVLTVEAVGAAGTGLVAHLSPVIARRLRVALRDALREIGEDEE